MTPASSSVRRFFLSLLGVLALAFAASGAKADVTFSPSGTINMYSCTAVSGTACPGSGFQLITPSTWSGTYDITTGTIASGFNFGTGSAASNQNPFDLLTSTVFCNSTSSCSPGLVPPGGSNATNGGNPNLGTGFLPFASVPAGTTFEMEICAVHVTPSCPTWVVLDVNSPSGLFSSSTTQTQASAASVIGGVQIGNGCAGTSGNTVGPPASNVDDKCFILTTTPVTTPSGVPLPAALPLMATGLAGMWALLRRRKATFEESFDPVAA